MSAAVSSAVLQAWTRLCWTTLRSWGQGASGKCLPAPQSFSDTAAGLDQALLGNAVHTGDKSKDDQHIHDLVKLGAHLLVRPPAWLAFSLVGLRPDL